MALPPKSFRGTGRHVMAVPVLHQGRPLTSVPILFTLHSGHQFDLPFSVELWDENDQRVEELCLLSPSFLSLPWSLT